jgi:hypothetical protein
MRTKIYHNVIQLSILSNDHDLVVTMRFVPIWRSPQDSSAPPTLSFPCLAHLTPCQTYPLSSLPYPAMPRKHLFFFIFDERRKFALVIRLSSFVA